MPKEELVEFVRKFARKGFGPKTLLQYLIAIGQSKEDSEAAVNQVLKEMGRPLLDSTQTKKGMDPFHVFLIVAAVVLILAIIAIAAIVYMTRPICGNSIWEKGETEDTCCIDAGCPTGSLCSDNACEPIICGDCQYLDGDDCVDYECCDDSACLDNESCESYECQAIICDECQWLENRTCFDFECCEDADCNQTDYFCIDNACQYVEPPEDECSTDADCDDFDVSTTNRCAGTSPYKKCEFTDITACVSGDQYCPSGCSYPKDDECDECQYDWECNDSIVLTIEVCEGNPKRCETFAEYCPYGWPGADKDCDDGYDATFDYCKRDNYCANVLTTECNDNDLYCPSGCDSSNDNDCG